MSKFHVYLSPVAERKLEELLEHILEEWGQKSKNDFLEQFTNDVRKIEKFPKSCPESKSLKIHINVVSAQTSFYYRIKKKEIEILTITDNRQDPERIWNELKTVANKK